MKFFLGGFPINQVVEKISGAPLEGMIGRNYWRQPEMTGRSPFGSAIHDCSKGELKISNCIENR